APGASERGRPAAGPSRVSLARSLHLPRPRQTPPSPGRVLLCVRPFLPSSALSLRPPPPLLLLLSPCCSPCYLCWSAAAEASDARRRWRRRRMSTEDKSLVVAVVEPPQQQQQPPEPGAPPPAAAAAATDKRPRGRPRKDGASPFQRARKNTCHDRTSKRDRLSVMAV
ncbi:hypothetical protein Nmel_000134, partial [Mimus melanotis]